MNEVKCDCHWWLHKGMSPEGCGALSNLQCKLNGKCSFYETEEQYKARIEKQRGGE